MTKVIKYTSKTANAIKKASNIKTVIPGSSVKRSSPPAGASTPTMTPIQLKTKTNYNTYVGDVYANGLDNDATEEDATIRILVIDENETITGLDTDSSIFLGWKQKWGTGETETTQWTIQPEIWRGT